MADYIHMFATMAPERRAEALDEFEGLVHALCELEDEGKLDIKVNRGQQISVERDIPDDQLDAKLKEDIQ